MNFESEIKKAFDFIFNEFGFTLSVNDNNVTKDYLLLAYGQGMKLRFIQDRAALFMDMSFSTPSEKWISFYKVLSVLKDRGLISGSYKISNKLGSVKSKLKNYM